MGSGYILTIYGSMIMDSEKLAEKKAKLKDMEDMEGRIKRSEKAIADLYKNVGMSNVSVSIGACGNSAYRSIIDNAGESLIAIVKAGFIAHLDGLKSEFKKMKF
jgi:hypothetical protein